MPRVEYRPGTPDELATVVSLKLRMFQELGAHSGLVAEPDVAIREEYERMVAAGDLQHFVATEDGEVVACAVGILKRDPPFCFFEPRFYGFVADVYTVPASRRRGHAERLTQQVLDWLKQKGAKRVALLPSRLARPMYEKLGFKVSGEMVLHIE